MKRANGSGSVYKKRDSRRRNPFVAVINLGMDNTGIRKKKILGSFPTFRKAQAALEAYNAAPTETKKGAVVTIKQLWDMYIAQQSRVGKTINQAYISAYKKHVSKIERLAISDVKAIHMQSVLDTSGRASTGQAQIVTIFKAIFRIALANDLIVKDYSQFLKIKPLIKSTIHKPFSEEEMRYLWTHADNLLLKIVLIQIYTGMRALELSTMELDHVHLAENYMIGGVKTDAGKNRIIPIATCILPFIKEFYEKSRLKKSKTLLTTEKGLPCHKGLVHIGLVYKKLPAEIQHLSHDARHTFVTLCSNYGLDDMSVKLIIGHKQGDITKDVYTHRVIEQLLSTVNTLPHGSFMKMYPEKFGSHLGATSKK